MPTPILVTCAAGNVGRSVVDELVALGEPVRAGDLAPAGAADGRPGVTWTFLDLTDPSSFAPALTGVRRVFLLRPPPIARVGPTVNRFLDAAVAAGVEHVVFSSVLGADRNRVVPHHRIEQHLFGTGLDWTVLRPGFFAQNLGSAYLTDIRDDDRLHVPAGRGRAAFVDVRDLGTLAARILHDPDDHRGHAYELTGPEAVAFEQVAALLTDELGRTVRYEPATVLGYLRHLGSRGLPLPQRLVQTVLHVGLRRGDAERVDPTLPTLLGRPARTLRDYVHDHRDLWSATPDGGQSQTRSSRHASPRRTSS